ncbi:hypothetical protein C7123_10510 [Tannerella serpentiformis]|nr:hypothetical protein BCB71_03050 [Tannerella serpentiformis]AVV54091.1 hypothetical protein C7123_10510 [Tannerella serpentiformis]
MKSDGKKVSIDPLPVIAIIASQSSSRQTTQANAAAMQIHRIRKNRRRKAIWSVAQIRYTKANSIKMAVNSSETPMAFNATIQTTIQMILCGNARRRRFVSNPFWE